MFRLTTRQRFSLIFTLYVFAFIVILYSLFFTVFNYASYSQMRKDLTDDMNEIINNHLLINNDQIIFRKDKTGASLKQFLFNENASAIIVSKNGTEVRTYGIFIYDDSSNSRFKTNFLPTLNKVAKTKTSTEKQIVWGEQTLQSLVIPLLNDSKPVGALILAKSTSNIMDLQKSLVIMLSSLAVLSLFGSYFVGYVLARYSLDPLLDLTKVVEKIDLDRLEADLKIEGNPHDELVLLINKFNEMIKRLKDMNDRQQEFIANASHELKTPLTRIVSSLEIIDFTKQSKREIELIKSDVFYIDDLLDKLLVLTKLKDANNGNSPLRLIKMETVFSRINKMFKQKLEDKKIKLTTSYPQTLVIAMPVQYLEIIVSNILSNSIKYSAAGKTIAITVKKDQNNSVMEIVDQGIGMSQEETRQMFDRFYRSKRSRESGHGIGLSIVKEICDIYKVAVKVDSELGKGTIVTLTFKNHTT